ncbi:predicted protein [Naegleria gruberi]|uniref:Predicted protein n=1 Tax=Naegleria gruberi TaxID=5762 RepID=D2VMH9_NAEGR|nr:uncharacterized protein NAEGRDRAFT_70142 [Naegleria gruberi]EFC42064.1 predicted protein [Naegleria gruberi]|eukprot:XP_002674808.1 predicted protein [Naegleria gruberi strain NEG-M]
MEKEEDEVMFECNTQKTPQPNNSQNTNTNPPPKKSTKCNSIRIEMCQCGNKRKATKAPCKSCRQCCLNNGGCTTHQFKCSLIESIEEYDVLILDFETTDLQTRAPTDCYIYNISKDRFLSFPKYILPRVKILRDAEKLTGITNELVQNGTKEMEAVKLIVDFLPKKSLILAHNAPFDKSVLHRAFNYWRMNNSKTIDGLKNSHIIFLDTIPILKKALKLEKNQCKLGNIYQQLFRKSIENQHTAAADVIALKEILEHVFGKESVIRNVKNHFKLIKDLKKSFLMVDSNGNEMKDSLDKIIAKSL